MSKPKNKTTKKAKPAATKKPAGKVTAANLQKAIDDTEARIAAKKPAPAKPPTAKKKDGPIVGVIKKVGDTIRLFRKATGGEYAKVVARPGAIARIEAFAAKRGWTVENATAALAFEPKAEAKA